MGKIMRALRALLIVGLLAFVPDIALAISTGVQLFTKEADARQHCPADTIVWVNGPTGIYHFKGMRWYGNTNRGAYICKKEGDQAGYRATRNGQ